MFGKLLKYDLRAVGRLWWIGAAASLVASVLAALLIRFFYSVAESNTKSVILNIAAICAFFAAFFCMIAVVLAFVFTLILVYVRYYKHFFTDEAYLTFTLPVKRSMLFFSKIVNAVIWYSLHLAVIVFSVLFFAVLVTPAEKGGFFINFYVFEVIGQALKDLWLSVGAWLVVYILEALLLFFAYMLYTMLLVHFCITVGAVLVKKAKILLSIGIYYLVSSAMQVIGQFLFMFIGTFTFEGIFVMMQDAGFHQTCAVVAFLLMALIGAIFSVASVLYSLTEQTLSRKLNLA